jgi:SAM-dependent methyltransferase
MANDRAAEANGTHMPLLKSLAAPLRAYFNPRFDSVAERFSLLDRRADQVDRQLEALASDVGKLLSKAPAAARIAQAELLARIDLREHNADPRPPRFDALECQSVSAGQCDEPAYREWSSLIENWDGEPAGQQYNRKLWEWAYIAEAVRTAGLMEPGRHAVGFGVGNEPMPAIFARHGVRVLATDQGWETGQAWAPTHELMGTDLTGLSRPHIVDDSRLAELVRLREVDMNAVPDDLGQFDITWSSCVIEHLGSPARGLEFVLESCRRLRPGGIAVHTTELELTAQDETRDYGHLAVYRLDDLRAFLARLPEVGCEATVNFTVSMDTFEDRWVSLVHTEHRQALPDGPHLKLAIGDSVSTSFGLLLRKTG